VALTSLLRESQATEALAGISGRNCKLIVVKPERRGGWHDGDRITDYDPRQSILPTHPGSTGGGC
jgi:hypothetical protein